MVSKVAYEDDFKNKVKKVDISFKIRIKKQIRKIIEDPEIGKPMKYGRSGTREVRIPPFRLSYKYERLKDKVVFLDFYHKDEQ